MNETMDISSPCDTFEGFDLAEKLREIENILAELNVYVYRNPEDDIARLQLAQFDRKREALADKSERN